VLSYRNEFHLLDVYGLIVQDSVFNGHLAVIGNQYLIFLNENFCYTSRKTSYYCFHFFNSLKKINRRGIF
jgi:hypothetical protein